MPADALPPGRPMPGRANSGRPTPGSSSSGPSTLGHGLDRLFSPRSIAVVGASDRPGSFGLRTLTNLEAFEGELIPINPRRAAEGGEILGRPARASVSALEAPPDLVVIATPKETVQGVVEEAAAKGAGGAVVFASGFQELGTPEGIAA
ncbi:MAG: CoA-binding protein, partial [Pseudomonadota bacterium]